MTANRQNGSLFVNIENTIATIEFGHPASNSFPSELLDRLTNELNNISKLENVNVVVLKSEGEKAFCAGASFNELVNISNLEEGKRFFSGFANVINAMRKCGKIIVGRIQGKVVGGGVGLAASCDYVFATESASIKLSELTIGIGPFVIEPAVKRKIGLAATSDLTLDAKNWKTAYWAKEKGLYSKVFENLKELDDELLYFTKNLASYNPKALNEMKNVLWENTNHWDELLIERAEISGALVLSDFTKNSLAKFSK